METQLKNDDLTADIERSEGCLVKFNVHLNPKSTSSVRKQAIKRVNKGVSVPGFRKGKAPESMLLKQFAKYVDEEWEYLIGHTALTGCMDLSKLTPINDRAIQKPQVKQMSLEEGAVVLVAYEHAPIVPEIELSTLVARKISPVAVKEEEVTESVEQLRKASSTWEKITDRPIQEGDIVVLDVFSLEHPEQPMYKEQPFEVADKKMGKWMRDLLIGKEVGVSVEGESQIDEDAPEEEKEKFQPVQLKIDIKEIRISVLPDLDEALAKKLGFENLEKLHEHVLKKLESENEAKAESEQVEVIENELRKHYGFDIPKSLFEQQRQVKIRQRIEELQKQKASREEILAKEAEIENEVAEEVEKMIHLYYIFRKIGEQANLTVSNEEVTEQMNQYQYLNFGKMAAAELQNLRHHSEDVVWNRKIRDHLMNEVRIQEMEEDGEETSAKEVKEPKENEEG